MERLIRYCNTFQYPMLEFINRTSGPGAYLRPRPADLAMRWPPYTEEELLHEFAPPRFEITEDMISRVNQPADRIAFMCYATAGVVVGHNAAMARADFQ